MGSVDIGTLRLTTSSKQGFFHSNGRHQEEDAGDEGGEGQCHGQS